MVVYTWRISPPDHGAPLPYWSKSELEVNLREGLFRSTSTPAATASVAERANTSNNPK